MKNFFLLFKGLRRFGPFLLILLSAVVAVIAYMQAFNYPFLIDDGGYLVENKKLAGLQLVELWRLFTVPYNPFHEFLPLRELSYWIDLALFGLEPTAFRMHSIVLYLFCLPLVYGTTLGVWKYFRPLDHASALWAAAAVTALFALHPSHTEAVVWASGRKDVLSGLFSLLAIWFALNIRRGLKFSLLYATVTLFALTAAMLSKATAVAVSSVVVVFCVVFWHDFAESKERRLLLLWLSAVLFLAMSLAWVVASFGGVKLPTYFGVESVIRSLAILGWLARLAVSPESRHFLYPLFEDPYLPAMVALGAAVLVAAMIGALAMLRKRSLLGFALVVFFLLCMPSLQLIPYSPPSLVSDRFVFLAVWPAALMIVTMLWHIEVAPRRAILLIIALAWGFQTVERTRDWRSFEALVETDLHAYPGYYMPAVYQIVGVQLPRGLRDEAMETAVSIANPDARDIMIRLLRVDQAIFEGKHQEAMELLHQFSISVKRYPVQAQWDTPIYNVWGKGYMRLKVEWDLLVKKFPDDVSVRYNAGLWLLGTKFGGAAENLRVAIESDQLPMHLRGTAFKNYGLALMDSGHTDEAEPHLLAALVQSPPDFRAYCLLSVLYKQSGRAKDAALNEAECRSRVQSMQAVQ